MNCTACNAELKHGAATCLECGAAVAVPAPATRVFGDYVKLAIRIVQLDETAALDAANDPGATLMAVAFVAISGMAPVIGALNPFILPFTLSILIAHSLVVTGVVHLCTQALGGKGSFAALYRAQGLCYIVGWTTAVPILGVLVAPLLSLIYTVYLVNNVRIVHRVPLVHAIAAGLLSLAVVAGAMLLAVMTLGLGFFAVVLTVFHH